MVNVSEIYFADGKSCGLYLLHRVWYTVDHMISRCIPCPKMLITHQLLYYSVVWDTWRLFGAGIWSLKWWDIWREDFTMMRHMAWAVHGTLWAKVGWNAAWMEARHDLIDFSSANLNLNSGDLLTILGRGLRLRFLASRNVIELSLDLRVYVRVISLQEKRLVARGFC